MTGHVTAVRQRDGELRETDPSAALKANLII